MVRTHEQRPWVLMSAEAALERQDVIQTLSEVYDVILVPADRMQEAIELLDQPLPAQEDGQ